ncbi:GntR family transcriptional regulator [Amycolatopsis sp. NBRC 101858]|jgi:DNA-binding GntR family transcriptional regulator|uniref:GntR family transcriptional regulator n=1 Tax=Amycolatopsis sp. NBRC 101858 TaxID=3032200 RepID=UPI0024A4497C|nr:GntR family transcriptional regulator [Amycolatopsis sp. NBRC 101858]GLY44117.1 GntR family transcriptional regulator [Amycolatopsis sp. NBRC 101858]
MARTPLRSDLIEEITARVLDGRFAAGARVNEVHLARELGVSRTPLREALIGLADRGLLVSAPGRGFLVPPFDLDEARRLYPLVAELEALALRWTSPLELAGLPDALDAVADEMAGALERGADLSEVDERWHALLLSRCPNAHLLRLIGQTKPLLKRYESCYFGGAARAGESIGEHRRIAAALRDGDLAAASAVLVRNWVKALAYLGKDER